MFNKIDKNSERLIRHERVRKHLSGTTELYAQVIDDTKGATLASASSQDKALEKQLKGKTKTEQARIVGEELAKRALKAKVKTVVFDRGGYIYTGRVQALADGARSAGLEF